LGAEHVVAVGNGRNDVAMFEAAALGIAVLGPEGAAGVLLQVADVVVPDVYVALELLLHPRRLKATLRA
jgi:soluble P-type ATPase